MSTSQKGQAYVCTHSYDPYYGLRMLKPGDTIQVTPDLDKLYPSYRVTWQSNAGQQLGFGWSITQYELNQHFKPL